MTPPVTVWAGRGCPTPAQVLRRVTNVPEEETKLWKDAPEAVLVSLAGTPGFSLNSALILSN